MTILKFAFATDRKRFKELVEEFISGALNEYTKMEVARANDYMDYIEHWEKEVTGQHGCLHDQ